MISVAMATYNGERFIIQQLSSILNQSVSVDEVIICDDCSTDSTVSLISDFIENNTLYNWRVIKNQENLGFSKKFF